MELKEMTKAIRSELKAKGITNKQVSVKGSYAGYSEAIAVIIKDLKVNKKTVEEIVKQFHSVDHDERTGEILEGGNTYTRVDFDYDAIKAAREDYRAAAENIINKYDLKYGNMEKIAENEEYTLYYSDYCGEKDIQLCKKVLDENRELSFLQNIQRRYAGDINSIAEALAIFINQYGIKLD